MAKTFNASWDPAFSATLANSTGQNTIPDRLTAGAGAFAKLKKQLANGTGANNAATLWHQQRTVAGGVNDDIDLMSLTDAFGAAITWTLIQWFLLRLTAPATGVKLILGNQGASGWTGWFVSKNYSDYVHDQLWRNNQIDGWAVSGSERYLRLNNPGAGSVTYDIVLIGQ